MCSTQQNMDKMIMDMSISSIWQAREMFNHATYNSSTPKHCNSLTYGFKVSSYDKTEELIIDPLLASTFLGGSGSESAYSMVLDSDGNVYITGDTESPEFLCYLRRL